MKITYAKYGRLAPMPGERFGNHKAELSAELEEGDDSDQCLRILEDKVRSALGEPSRAAEKAGKLLAEADNLIRERNNLARHLDRMRVQQQQSLTIAADKRKQAAEIPLAAEAAEDDADRKFNEEADRKRLIERAESEESRAAAYGEDIQKDQSKLGILNNQIELREANADVTAARVLLGPYAVGARST